METIFMDESGYTGTDLLNSEQSVFALATLHSTETMACELADEFFKKVSSGELHHTSMRRRPNQQNMICYFLAKLAVHPELLKINLVHKKYVLTNKIVDFIIEPAARKIGIDLYQNQQNQALTNLLYTYLPIFGGQDFFEDLLRLFQNMMRELDSLSYTKFYDLIFNYQVPTDEIARRELGFLLKKIQMGPLTIGDSFLHEIKDNISIGMIPESGPLDIGLASTLFLMDKWRREISGEMTLLYDNSSAMSKALYIWNVIADPSNPIDTVGYGNNILHFPIAVNETRLEESKQWRGLQLADILAGSAAYWAKWLYNGRNLNDEYGCKLDKVVPTLPLLIFEPSNQVDRVETNMDNKNTNHNNEYISNLLIKRKREALHRLQEMGATFFYMVKPEQDKQS